MTGLDQAIRARLNLEPDHESMSGESFALISDADARDALFAVLDLHPVERHPCSGSQNSRMQVIAYDRTCPTRRVIAEKLGVEADGE